jgi:hypothetical protein
MKTIIIEIDEQGAVTVDDGSGEVAQFMSADEALPAVQAAMMGGEMDEEAMWDEEAAARPAQPNLMM